jgi:predicted kinase
MKNWELIRDFQLKFPHLARAMEINTHHWDEKTLNQYHYEGNTLAHVFMVVMQTDVFNDNLNVRIAALCHDLGKPMCTTRSEEKKRVRMFGHEAVSVFLALDFLKTLDLSASDKIRICQLISFHTYLYQEMRKAKYEADVAKFFAGEQNLFQDIISLTRADALGRWGENEDRSIWIKAEETFAPILHKITPVIYPRLPEFHGEAIILVGPPLSGKSTWVKKNAPNHLILSRDEITLELGKTDNYNEAFLSVDHDLVNKIYIQKQKDALKSGQNLVFDLTHMSEKSRRRSLQGLPKQMKRKAVMFLTGYDTLIKRNEIRGKEQNKWMNQYVMLNMMSRLSMPMKSEGFDEIQYVFEEDQS